MPTSKTVLMAGIGPVLFSRSSRAKYMRISMRPFYGIRVAVPGRMSVKRAEALVRQKESWIQKNLARNRAIEAEYAETMGKFSALDLSAAREYLTQRTKILASRHGFIYNRIYIRKQRTRWGSCSAKNNISLNAGLMILPMELQDYVILHELLHTRIKNHGPSFWSELEKYIGPDLALYRKRLKQIPVPV